jgi:hypothetical protein
VPAAAVTAGLQIEAVAGMSDAEIEQLLAKRFAVS